MALDEKFKSFLEGAVDYFEINPQMKGHLASSLNVVEPHLDQVLHKFYENLQKYPEMVEILGGSSRGIDTLKSAQKKHWKNLFLTCGEMQHGETVHRIGQIHERIGLTPNWYIGGYANIMCDLMDAMFDEYQPKSGILVKNDKKHVQMREEMKAMTRAIFFDMAMAISVYEEKQTKFDNIMSKTEAFTTAVMDRIQDSVAATEELSASSVEISRDIQNNNENVVAVNNQMQQIQKTVDSFDEMTGSISSILSLIHGVADQINLLSLNAAIESARAGEAGRGFAVVADEVRKLAGETNKSVSEISEKIDEIQGLSQTVVTEVDKIAGSIAEVSDRSASMNESVTQQAEATSQISENFYEMREQVNVVGADILDVVKKSKKM